MLASSLFLEHTVGPLNYFLSQESYSPSYPLVNVLPLSSLCLKVSEAYWHPLQLPISMFYFFLIILIIFKHTLIYFVCCCCCFIYIYLFLFVPN